MKAKIKEKIYFSILLSLLIHLGFLVWSVFIKIIPNLPIEKPQQLIHVKITKEEKPVQPIPPSDAKASEESLQPQNPFAEAKAVEPSTPSQEAVKDTIASAIQNKNESLVPAVPQEMENFAKPRVTGDITQKVKRSVHKDLIEMEGIHEGDFISGLPVVDSGDDISKNFLEKSNVVMQAAPTTPIPTTVSQDEFQIMQISAGSNDKKSKTVDLGTSLVHELYTYPDPRSGQKYFKLLVKVRDATINFPVIPKEIIFLVDASNSIGKERLKQFQEGLMYSLNHLNPDDRFNLIIFKDKIIPFSPESLKPDGENIKKAVEFLQNLKVGSRTDVYNVLQTSINLENSFVPSYRVLLSDGLPTKGVTDSCQIINAISKINNGRVSIFAFGGGVNVSKYMLDFLAYKNRGWSQLVDREYFIGREFSKMYDKIKDPLLLNLRYHISGVNEKEVFPQILPDFFKGSDFTIYGTYTDENKFFVQVLGNVLAASASTEQAAGETKEFVVNAALAEAVAGNKEIAREWAFHKIYHLIGELKYDETNAALIKEIDELSAKFDIVTVYSKKFQVPRTPPKPQEPPKEIDPTPVPQ